MFVASAVNARLDLTGRCLCRITDTTWYSWFMLIGGGTQLCGGLMFLGIVSLPAQLVELSSCGKWELSDIWTC